MVPRQGSVEVRAAYHAARNEILRPGATVFCSRYFCEKWIPRLGGTATALVLTLRAIAVESASNAAADDSPQAVVEVSQQTLGRRVGCSANTIYRELKSNAELAHFVRTEERYVRNPKGRVRQSESVYYIAMDDPLLPEDEPLLEQIVERKAAEAAAPRPERVIIPERAPASTSPAALPPFVHQNGGQGSLLEPIDSDVVRQNDGQQRADRSANLMDNSWSPKMRDYKVTESNLQKPVTVTPPGAGTGGVLHASQSSDGLAAWRQTTEDLARHSAKELDDLPSMGYHIAVWNHARKHDKQRGGRPMLTDGVFDILRDLSHRRAQTPKPQPQGRAWTRRTQKWFEENGIPMQLRASIRTGRGGGGAAEEAEEDAASIRAALANAPFMRNRAAE
jgi:hypothetical protein